MLGQIITMNKEILYKILTSESETLSSAEIESIMNEELDKSPQDMDTDLIDLCLEALNNIDEEKPNKRKKKCRIGKILLAASIFAAVIGISIPACAKYLNINVPDGIVTVYKDCFSIDLMPDEYVDDIYGQLEHDGVDNAFMPMLISEPSVKIKEYSMSADDNATLYAFDFYNEEIQGQATIIKYNSYDSTMGKGKVSSTFEKFKTFDVDDINVLVCGNDKASYILYIVDDIEYNISIECNYEMACQIIQAF